jgi:antitoxin component of RelBE/YafQ-DinJ toxin-antitoxin module
MTNAQQTVLVQTRISQTMKEQVDDVLQRLGISSLNEYIRISIQQLINKPELNLVSSRALPTIKLTDVEENVLQSRLEQVKSKAIVGFASDDEMINWLKH